MPEIQLLFNRHRKYIFTLLSIYTLGWVFTSYQTIFLGLILGTSIGLYGHWQWARKMSGFGDAVLAGKKIRSLGTLARMAGAILAVIIATRYPDKFHLLSVIMGLMTPYIVIMIDYLIQQLKFNE